MDNLRDCPSRIEMNVNTKIPHWKKIKTVQDDGIGTKFLVEGKLWEVLSINKLNSYWCQAVEKEERIGQWNYHYSSILKSEVKEKN